MQREAKRAVDRVLGREEDGVEGSSRQDGVTLRKRSQGHGRRSKDGPQDPLVLKRSFARKSSGNGIRRMVFLRKPGAMAQEATQTLLPQPAALGFWRERPKSKRCTIQASGPGPGLGAEK